MSSFPPRVGAIILASFVIAPLSGCGGGGGGGSTVSVTVPSSAPAPGASSAGVKPAVTDTSAGAKKPAVTAPRAQGNAPATNPGDTSSSASTPASTQGASPPPSGHLIHRFTGTGSGRLGMIVVNVPSVLSWHAARAPIQIFTSSGFLLVQSGASNGSVRLSKGTYRGVRVATHAGWSIELRTRAS